MTHEAWQMNTSFSSRLSDVLHVLLHFHIAPSFVESFMSTYFTVRQDLERLDEGISLQKSSHGTVPL